MFRDIESLVEGEEGMSRITEAEREEAEADDEEEVGLNSFSFDGTSVGVVNVMTGVEDADDLTTDSEDDEDRGLVPEGHELHDGFDSDEDLPAARVPPPVAGSAAFSTLLHARTQPQTLTQTATPVVRGVMKSTSNTPVSALKNGSGSRYRTPAEVRHRRSVSFSDGKTEGPIRGVGRNTTGVPVAVGGDERSAVFVPSARSKRIADMMEDLENPGGFISQVLVLFANFLLRLDFEEDESPTRTTSSGRRSFDELQPLAVRKPAAGNNSSLSRRVFSRAQTHKPSPDRSYAKANATFLTECSFAVTHDRLVQVITDVEPFEPYWEGISLIDLSKRNVESVARLKEFLPKLDSLCL